MHKINGRSKEAERDLSKTQPEDSECNNDYNSTAKAVRSA